MLEKSPVLQRRAAAVTSMRPVDDADEIGHRIYNSLQLVASFLSAQARDMTDPASRVAFEDSVQRIAAIAGIQRQLYQSPHRGRIDIATYLLDLACLLRSTGGEHRQVRIEAEPAFVEADAAKAMGIIVTELVINACKHAYAPDEAGDVDVTLTFDADGRFGLEVRDYGRRLVRGSPVRGDGLGTRIVDVMSRRLDGTTTYLPDDSGMRVLVRGKLGGSV